MKGESSGTIVALCARRNDLGVAMGEEDEPGSLIRHNPGCDYKPVRTLILRGCIASDFPAQRE